jgi:hypothetical protein
VDGVARPFPTWFDAKNGKTQASPGYTQIRLCWNTNDWGHGTRPDGHTPPVPAAGTPWSQAPNGHWHCRHAHLVKTEMGVFPVSHGGISNGREIECGASGFGGGHPMDDQPTHSAAVEGFGQIQHAQVPCPTCGGLRPAANGSRWSDVKKSWRDARPQDGMDLGVGSDFPRPIMPRASLLRSGVTVAAWRDSHSIGTIFPASPWGMIAVASAQVGLQDDEGRILLLRALADKTATYGGPGGSRTIPVADAADPRSFFYSRDPQRGMRFGARLVPVAGGVGGLSPWHPALEDGGLDAMLGPTPRRWVDTETRSLQAPPAEDWRALSGFLRIRTEREMREAMWH